MRTLSVIFIAFILLIKILPAQAQRLKSHPLSRDDSAKVTDYLKKRDQALARSDMKIASDWMNHLARIYWDHNIFEEAAKYYENSLQVNKKLGNENGIAMINSNLGLIYHDMLKFEKAKTFLEETLAARRAKGEKVGMISALINISVVLNNMKKYNESTEYLEEALALARERNDPNQMKSCYGMLAETYQKAGNTEKTTQYFKLYATFHNMVQKKRILKVKTELKNQQLKVRVAELAKENKELQLIAKNKEIEVKDSTNRRLTRNLTKKEMKLRMANQEMKIKELEAERNSKELAEEKKSTRNSYLLIGFFALLLVGAHVLNQKMRRTNKKLMTQNTLIREQQSEILVQHENLEEASKQIEKKSEEISASINYASLIQSASLFRTTRLNDIEPNSFIFFLPKDVVSGDFYWYHKIGKKLLVAAVDCTGHGVPGGFMSMIANNLMSDIILNKGIHEPAQILEQLDAGVQVSLNQRFSGNKDGMDMSICVIDYPNNNLVFAGAKNPMIIIQNGEMQQIKGTRRSIGGDSRRRQTVFEQVTIPMKEENSFYLFSDGFQDQFGGPKRRKFGTRQFRELLVKIHKEDFTTQHNTLFDTLEDWKGDGFQVDDLLVVGLNVSKSKQQA